MGLTFQGINFYVCLRDPVWSLQERIIYSSREKLRTHAITKKESHKIEKKEKIEKLIALN